MLSASEKQDLVRAYRAPVNARAILARAALGLAIVVTGALIGAGDAGGDTWASVTAERVASGR